LQPVALGSYRFLALDNDFHDETGQNVPRKLRFRHRNPSDVGSKTEK
jgi:hypothetical protein